MTRRARPLALLLSTALVLAACASLQNTPAQELAEDRWYRCNHFASVKLDRIDTDGTLHVWYAVSGEAELFKQCLVDALAEQQRAGKIRPGMLPPVPQTASGPLVPFAYFTDQAPAAGAVLVPTVASTMPPDVKQFHAREPVIFFFGLTQRDRPVAVATKWYGPDGNLVTSVSGASAGVAAPGQLSWQAHTLDGAAIAQVGTWNVDLVVDGQAVGRYQFEVVSGPQ